MSTQTGPALDTQPRGHAFVPGPKGLPLVGNLPQFGKDPLAFFELLRGHGDMVRWRFGRNRCVFIADPDLVGELLTETERTFDQPKLGIAFRTVLGNGMLVARGRDWRRKRSLVQPSVRPKQVKSYATTMADCAVELADRWADGQRVDVKREMSALTQKIAVRTIFGVDTPRTPRRWGGRWTSPRWRSARSSPGSARCCRTGCRHRAGRGSGRPPPSSTPRYAGSSPGTGAARRNAPICSMRLLTAVDESGTHLSDEEIRDEAVTLYIGGHETTSTTLVWAWYLLARNPRVRDALAEELDRVLGDREPGFEDYAQLHYTQAVVKETLRLFPAIWLITGIAKEGATIGGLPVEEGTRVWSSQWATHRDARWFPEPEEFRPERWDATDGDEIPEYAWFPFGGGPRVCIGTRFAMVESVLLLAVLARRFTLDVDPGEITPLTGLTLQPDRDLLATVRAR